MPEASRDDVLELLAPRRGHFLLKSGYHGDLWLNLELLCRDPRRVQPFCSALAAQLRQYEPHFVCAPLVEGAFVGLFVASELAASFVYSERFARPAAGALFPAGYRLPDALRSMVRGKRIAIVNDVIHAGSSVRGTFEDLQNCNAQTVAIGALLTLGNAAQQFADSKGVPLVTLGQLPNSVWNPSECPLCAAAVPLEDVAGFRRVLASNQNA